MKTGYSILLLLITLPLFATDLAVGLIFSPDDSVFVNDTVPVEFEVQNLNILTAESYSCAIAITNEVNAVVFSEEIEGKNLSPFTIDTLVTKNKWSVANVGAFKLKIDISFSDEINPSNNTKTMDITAVEKVEYLSREQAIDLFKEQVLADSPFESPVSFLYKGTGSDSLVKPETVISPFDSSFFHTVEKMSYFFWMDNLPDEEWLHPTSFVFMDAITGDIEKYDAESWPQINGEDYLEFTEGGNASPNLIAGLYPISFLPYTYVPKTTKNDSVCAVVVVGRNQDGKREKNARINDLARVDEILNGVPRGPQIDKDHIITVAGDDTLGATIKQVLQALEQVKGKKCRKLYFYYMGHGAIGSMLLKREGKNLVDRFTYEMLAKKLLETGVPEVCIVIEACYSGSAIETVKKAEIQRDGKTVRLNGSIVTSSSKSKTTLRNPDGAPFNVALNECFKDERADLNRDGKVTVEEATAWAEKNNSKVSVKKPQGAYLSDDRRIVFGSPKNNSIRRGFTGATLTYDRIIVCYRIKSEAKIDTVCRSFLYVTNPFRQAHKAQFPVDVICFDSKGRERTVHTFTPNLGPKEKKCFFELPPDCIGWDIRKHRPRHLASSQSEFVSGAVSNRQTSRVQPGQYIFKTIDVFGTEGDEYTVEINGLPNWNLTASPENFTRHAVLDSEIMIIRGVVPDTALTGGEFAVNVINESNSDTLVYPFTMLLQQSVNEVVDGANLTYSYVRGAGINSTSGSISLKESVYNFETPEFVSVASNGLLMLDNATIRADDAVGFGINVQGKIDWQHALIIEPEEGVTFDNASGAIHNSSIVASQDDGLKLYGDLSQLDADFLFIDASALNGIVLEAVPLCTLKNVRIDNSAQMDIVAQQSSNLHLLNGEYDSSKVFVDESSTLTQAWVHHFAVLGKNDTPLADVQIEIKDVDGNIVFNQQTDQNGFSESVVLKQFENNGGVITLKTPHTVSIRGGEIDTSFSYKSDNSRFTTVHAGRVQVSVSSNQDFLPSHYFLGQNYPNPFNSSTHIFYDLPKESRVELSVYNSMGRKVSNLVSEWQPAGRHSIHLNANDFATGVYYFSLKAGEFAATRKMMLVK